MTGCYSGRGFSWHRIAFNGGIQNSTVRPSDTVNRQFTRLVLTTANIRTERSFEVMFAKRPLLDRVTESMTKAWFGIRAGFLTQMVGCNDWQKYVTARFERDYVCVDNVRWQHGSTIFTFML